MKNTGEEPDIIMITEVIPKAQRTPIADVLLTIPGYTTYTSFDPSLPGLGTIGYHGVCIYVNITVRLILTCRMGCASVSAITILCMV